MDPGTKVRVKGLVKAAQHNGKMGVVTKATAPGEGRVGVKLAEGTILAVKIGNLEVVVNDEKPTTTINTAAEPKQRTLKREHALLREFDGSLDPNTLALYYHLADRAFDCFNAPEYNVQMMRYYDKDLSVRLVIPRKIGANEYFMVGLQHSVHEKNVLCEMAFNCVEALVGLACLSKGNALDAIDPVHRNASGVCVRVSARMRAREVMPEGIMRSCANVSSYQILWLKMTVFNF